MRPSLPFRSHEANFEFLLNLFLDGRLPHALLLTGPEGIGKSLFAAHLAQAILCQSENPPCGTCGACALLSEKKHPDLLELIPDNQRIKIDAIRELIDQFSFAPLMGNRRVVLATEAHLLNPAAANALLKTLEEPPSDTFFILATHAPGWLPRTIISRCQIVRLHPLPEATMREIISTTESNVSDADLQDAQGSVGRALRMSELRREHPNISESLASLTSISATEAYQVAQQVVDQEKLEPFLEALLGETRRKLLTLSPGTDLSFDLLVFTDKILEMRRRLKLNINAKMNLTRLLQFFQEPLTTRLDA